jgi:hypothetical protein
MKRALTTTLLALALLLGATASAAAWSVEIPEPEFGKGWTGYAPVAATASESEVAMPAASTTTRAAAAIPLAKGGVKKPKIKWDPISYSKARKRQMANYSKRHYGEREWKLKQVKAIVLHYTAGDSYRSAWSLFNANTPSLGEKPGTCAQFVVDQDGTVYQLTRLSVRCRHTIGLNHISIGIEMVQPDLGDPNKTAKAILRRKQQSNAAVRLASWLTERYGVKLDNVIGHGMANDSPLFLDKQGWVNDHVDWLTPQVKDFRKRMKKLLG